MLRWLKNVGYLMFKELKSLFSDIVMIILAIYMFSVAIFVVSNMGMTDVKNGSVAIIDYDQSTLSHRMRDALIMPYFKKVHEVSPKEIDREMDLGNYTFVAEFPPNYEKDMLKGDNPQVQVLVDATAITQAGIGSGYISQIFTQEVNEFMGNTGRTTTPIKVVNNVLYNPNHSSKWFMATTQNMTNLALLALMLVGSAIIREKERGTLEHLLVMPIGSSEIAMAKVFANGLVLLVISMLSIRFITVGALGAPIPTEQIALFGLGVLVFLFSIASLGIMLAVSAPSMPQFGLLCLPIYLIMNMLSGAQSPVENMPELAQKLTQFSPLTILAAYGQDVLFRGAGLNIVWPYLAKMAALGAVFLGVALAQFKSMLSKQG
ncbi:ABC transporter permease [Lonepinella sp. BR2882]|uniref:ABC transporter permease n=1 Tax=Lonepinella sp. BR2882 TaxID=3095283 RepID=UPI003F6E2456